MWFAKNLTQPHFICLFNDDNNEDKEEHDDDDHGGWSYDLNGNIYYTCNKLKDYLIKLFLESKADNIHTSFSLNKI